MRQAHFSEPLLPEIKADLGKAFLIFSNWKARLEETMFFDIILQLRVERLQVTFDTVTHCILTPHRYNNVTL